MAEMIFGIRKLQKVGGAFSLNMPIYAVRTLNLRTGDNMRVSLLDDGAIKIEKERIPATGAAFDDSTPVAGSTPNGASTSTPQGGMVANGIES